MKKLLIIIFIFGFSMTTFNSYGQGDPRAASYGAVIESGTDLIDNNVFAVEQTENIDGSPYFFEEWLKGEVLLIEDIKSNKLDIKIDTYRNQIHFLSGQDVLALDQKYVKEIYVEKNGETMVFRNGFKATGKLSENAFLQVLYDGKVKFYAHPRTFLREKRNSAFTSGRTAHEFKRDIDYYIQLPNNSLEKIRVMRRKYVLDILSYDDKLKKYAKENDLDFREKEDLAKILAYYDTLIK